jgi:ArsR family transcriptional regulator
LERLVQSGSSPADTAETLATDLKNMVDKVADEKTSIREARIFRALADPTRIRTLKLLSLRDMCVCEIMVALNLTQPTASHHLGILENAGLVSHRREGKWIFYSLQNKLIIELIDKLGMKAA